MKGFTVVATLGFFLLGPLPAFADDQLDSAYQPDSRPSILAPADSYFGRFRMSILGIKNAIGDVANRIDGATEDELPLLYHKLVLVEDAFIDLKHRYPDDTWLPRLSLSLAQAYEKLPFAEAQTRASTNLDRLIADYPDSDEAVYASEIRDPALHARSTAEVPIEPDLPSYAIPGSRVPHN